MYIKLAVRNVKRQVGTYLIYFMTVILTVALMFTVNNVIFSRQLAEYADQYDDLKNVLTGITIFLSMIVAFVLSYATSFMLKMRKREFGTYLTLGMTRGDILRIFLMETLVMCAAALCVGIFFGLFLYQCLMMLLTKLMGMEFAFAVYEAKGLIFTIVLVAVVFAVSSFASACYLKKVSIYQLIHGDKKAEKPVRHPWFWLAAAALSMMLIVGSCMNFRMEVKEILTEGKAGISGLLRSLLVFATGMATFHIGLARSAVCLLLKSRRLCSRGTNTFLLRQLGASLGTNSVMLGMLACLLSFAVIGANACFTQKVGEEELLNRDYPYDIMYADNMYGDGFQNSEGAILPEEAEPIIEKYVSILEKHEYSLYTNGENYLSSFTKWSGDGYDGMLDYYMPQSDFNGLCVPLGYSPIDLDHEFMIVTNQAEAASIDWSKAALVFNGETYRYAKCPEDYPIFQYIYYFAVVPDEAIQELRMGEAIKFAAYRLSGHDYDVDGLREALTYTIKETYGSESFEYEWCDYKLKEYGRRERNRNVAIFVVGALYIAAVFLLMAMAILALKTLSDVSGDKRRYRILFRLGAGIREQSQTLFRQTFCFFFLPYALPVLVSIPAGLICFDILALNGLEEQAREVVLIAGATAGVMTAIYVLYYTATYLIAKKAIVQDGFSG